ncbi:MAG: hypothetical protein HY901_37765, partial [Deltaproteobacteria bacterium]|nr:hypothetical protein [Deltaproteobacteria bacterium]
MKSRTFLVLFALLGCADRVDSTSAPSALEGDPLPEGSDCCSPHAEVGCSNPAVQACVSFLWPDCATGPWSSTCAHTAKESCGLYCPTDCCSVHTGGSCDIAGTEACVCYDLPECCSGDWSQACVDDAVTSCSLECPLPPTNDCCTVHSGPGCSDPDLQAC